MINLENHRQGIVLSVRAAPAARSSGIRGEQDGALKVSVTQTPEKGKANKAIVSILSKALKLRKSQIELLTGETSKTKRFLIRRLSTEELLRRISAALS